MAQLYSGFSGSGRLTLYDTRPRAIAAALAAADVRYRHVDLAPMALDADAETDEIVEAYRDDLDGLVSGMPCAAIDVLSVLPGDPRMSALTRGFMSEHAHAFAEAQLLVWGNGILFMRAPRRVYALYCQPGDFVALPAGIGHWFEINQATGIRTLRLFGPRPARAPMRRGSNMRDTYRLYAPIAATVQAAQCARA